MYHNEHVLNWDKISCKKIPLNIGSLFQNLICTRNLSTLLQLLILNKAYYLEIKIGLITRNLTKFSPPAAILELFLYRKRENAGSLCITDEYIQMRNSRVFLSSPLISRKQRTCYVASVWQVSRKILIRK